MRSATAAVMPGPLSLTDIGFDEVDIVLGDCHGTSCAPQVTAQIEAAFTPDQLTAIREMKLTSPDMQTWASANGVTLGGGSGQPGSGSGMSPEARATKQAAEGVTPGSSGGGASSALLNALITYLQGLAQ